MNTISGITQKFTALQEEIRVKIYDLMIAGEVKLIDFEHISDFFVTDHNGNVADIHSIVIEGKTVYLIGLINVKHHENTAIEISIDIDEVLDIHDLFLIMGNVNEQTINEK